MLQTEPKRENSKLNSWNQVLDAHAKLRWRKIFSTSLHVLAHPPNTFSIFELCYIKRCASFLKGPIFRLDFTSQNFIAPPNRSIYVKFHSSFIEFQDVAKLLEFQPKPYDSNFWDRRPIWAYWARPTGTNPSHHRLHTHRGTWPSPPAATPPPPHLAPLPPPPQASPAANLTAPAMAADWIWARRSWEKWAGKHVGASGLPSSSSSPSSAALHCCCC